jgi:arginase
MATETSTRPIALIEAPSSLGLRPPAEGKTPGAYKMAKTLIEAGLLADVSVGRHERLAEPPYSPEIGESGTRNLEAIRRFSLTLGQAVGAALAAGYRPLVLGGDCSVVLGPAIALKQRGHFGLVHIDGHNDFGHAGNWGKPYASIAGADLAVVTGRGPRELADIDGLGPYFRDEDVIQVGEKADPASSDYSFKDFPATAIRRLPLAAIRRSGIDGAIATIRAFLSGAPFSGYWVHLDLDVLDAALLPAVDSPDGAGLAWDELEPLVRQLWQDPLCAGMNVGIYDPDLDPRGIYARRINDLLRAAVLTPAKPSP